MRLGRAIACDVLSPEDLECVEGASLLDPDYFDAAILGAYEGDSGYVLAYSIEDLAVLYASHEYDGEPSDELYDQALACVYENVVDVLKSDPLAPLLLTSHEEHAGDDSWEGPCETFVFAGKTWCRA